MNISKIFLAVPIILACSIIIAAITYNELSQRKPSPGLPILLYHSIDYKQSRYSVTPENFRSHLEKLYKAGYVTARLEDVLARKEHLRNRKIILLRFDDSWKSQCNYLIDSDGTTRIDPTCAVGIILDFYKEHPSFGKHALFCITPTLCFQQPAYKKDKLIFLLNEGMELVNHGFYHVNVTNAQPEEIDANFGKAMAYWYRLLGPLAEHIKYVATPYGSKSRNEQAQQRLRCFTYKGITYKQDAVLYAGRKYTGCAHVPFCPTFDPYGLPCFEVTNDNFDALLASFTNIS